MSLFASSSRSRRNFRSRVLESASDSDNEDHKEKRKITEPEGVLSFIDQEKDEDYCEIILKKPERSRLKFGSKDSHRQKESKVKSISNTFETNQLKVTPPVFSQLNEGVIPSAAAIHAARKKRELARNLGSNVGANQISIKQPDYDENSDEAADTDVRQFGISEKSSKQMEVLSAIDNASSGSDEERFNEEQISKGVYSLPIVDISENEPNSIEYEERMKSNSSFPDSSSEFIKPLPISVESLKSQITCQLSTLREQNSRNSGIVKKLEEDMLTASSDISGLENHSQALTLQYQFFQEIRGYIRDLLSCLTEKVPEIKELENLTLAILKRCSELIIERRRQDIKDMANECTDKTLVCEETTRTRMVEREGRRRRRRELRSRVQGDTAYYEGQSSDDELLESTKIKLQSEFDEVVGRKLQVFSDVMDEFSRVPSILMHFREWKYSFPTSYNQAYISLYVPKVIAPYIRLQLISWNPLNPHEYILVEDLPWMQDLLFFDHQKGCEDNDLYFIPKLIELTVIPKLNDLLENVWDPLSSTQTGCLRKCIQYLMEDYPLDCLVYQNLFQVLAKRIKQTLENDVFIPLYPPEVMNNTSLKQYRFSQNQFWASFKLLGNIMMWNGILPTNILQELVVDGLLNRYILLSLQNSPASVLSIKKMEKILSLLPSCWWNSSGEDSISQQLRGLLRYLQNLIKLLVTEHEGDYQEIKLAIMQILQQLKESGVAIDTFDIS